MTATAEPIRLREALAEAIAPGIGRKRRIVWFAGGGGSSEGMKDAFGEGPDAALNHWPTAVFAHQRHHPDTLHFCSDAFDVHPNDVFPGEEIGVGWFSPDCTDFSKAKGKALRSERRRGLAWVVVDWAFWRRPDVIIVENVPEFMGWSPLYGDGHPKAGERIPELEGLTFLAWKRCLEEMGGVVEPKVMVSADYGDPTTRERLYVQIRFDGKPIAWPERTHAPRKDAARLGLLPWVGAHTQIDFSIPCPSIFMTREEAKAQKLRVNRPLKPATMRRVARGVDRFVIRSADPFIVPLTHQGGDRVHDVRDPVRTVTSANRGELGVADAQLAFVSNQYGSNTNGGRGDLTLPAKTLVGGGHHAIVAPAIAKFRADSAGADIREPGPTVTANSYQKRPGGAAPIGVVSPNLVRTDMASAAERNGIRDAREPMGTVTGAGGFAVSAPVLAMLAHGDHAQGAGARVRDVREPINTVKAGGGDVAVSTAFMSKFQTDRLGTDLNDPVDTVMAGATRFAGVAQNLISYYGNDAVLGSDLADPGRTVTGKARHGLSAAFMHQANTGMVGKALVEPSSTIVLKGCTQQLVEARLALEGGETGRRGQVLAFLWEHFGAPTEAEWADSTATGEGRLKFGLVLLPDGKGATAVWMIVDIGLRMLKPRELAGLMGMRPGFDLETDVFGRPISITDQTHLIGNMVTRHTSAAILRAACGVSETPEERVAA